VDGVPAVAGEAEVAEEVEVLAAAAAVVEEALLGSEEAVAQV
jgi:hypothetical protein